MLSLRRIVLFFVNPSDRQQRNQIGQIETSIDRFNFVSRPHVLNRSGQNVTRLLVAENFYVCESSFEIETFGARSI